MRNVKVKWQSMKDLKIWQKLLTTDNKWAAKQNSVCLKYL